MRKFIAIVVSNALALQTAFAAPAVTTANVNFRAGPGTGFQSFGTLPEGTEVDLGDCDETGAWCSVTYQGNTGFVSGSYLHMTEDQGDDDEQGWPRTYTTDKGATLILYQPQVSDWENFQTLDALVAAEYVAKEGATPVFGIIGLTGKTYADQEEGDVLIEDLTVTELNFSALDREAMTDLSLQVGKLVPTGPITVKEERITASLAEYKRMDDVSDLGTDAPPIFVSTRPAILVQTDGEAIFAPVKGASGLSFVVNTNWDMFKVDDGGTLYLRNDKSWLTSSDISSGWQETDALPELINNLPDDENWADAKEAIPPSPPEDGAAPKIFYSDKPAEMIVFEGEPKLEAVPGTRLEWASNTQSDVFYLAETKTWYILVSGRWFKSASLDGPWVFTTPDLPDDFRNIPEDASYYSVRASVPGTSEADQARLKASIPHTARVEEGTVSADVAYAGDPDFQPIEGTQMSYAVNTSDQVIKVGGKYYVLQDGVWFVGDNPNGPFQVATSVPDEIYTIPPSSPVYNTTYVRVYETEPGAVWFGYTMGYLAGFLAWGTIVYGTGWYYRPWYNRPWYRPGIYFPRPVTYGIGAYYNPVRGLYGRYGYAYGPYRGIAGGAIYNPRTGGYIRGGRIYGPRGSAGFIAAYNPVTGRGGVYVGGHGIYGSWKGGGVTRGPEWARARATGRDAAANRWQRAQAGDRVANLGRRGDVFAGRDGSVYRRQGDNWQKFDGGRWSGVDRPSREQLRDRAGGAAAAIGGAGAGAAIANRPGRDRPATTRPAQRPSAERPAQRPAQRPSASRPQQRPSASRPAQRPAARPAQAPSHLSRDNRARQAGNRQVNRNRAATRRPPSGGGRARGGGGRRGGGRR
ncbi:SH3 domain-containing protein [Stappia sp. GBMRC 2046]|uniref:SH3 domain-containing protein n=1 Tax=Stappia sediminis TaxID=2692190 RepID=A0A7X3LTP5_9HYPH|nr:SH3 domain-containing protein [Stappia sediminis]MXN64901.1 SH3 domain-containing protein [Stappia sediminis]